MNKELVIKLLQHPDAEVRELATAYKSITEHSWYQSTVTMELKLAEINNEIRNAKGARKISQGMKYMENIVSINESIEKMKAKLTPVEIEQLKTETTNTPYEQALDKIHGKT